MGVERAIAQKSSAPNRIQFPAVLPYMADAQRPLKLVPEKISLTLKQLGFGDLSYHLHCTR